MSSSVSHYSAFIIVDESVELASDGYIASDDDFELLDELEEAIGSSRIEINFAHRGSMRARGKSSFASAYGHDSQRNEEASEAFKVAIERIYGVTI